MKKVTASLDVYGVKVVVEGEYVPASKGSRDKYGAQEEPDEDEMVYVENMYVDKKSYELDELAKFLDISEELLLEQLEEALLNKYYDYIEAAEEARAIEIYESKKFKDENY